MSALTVLSTAHAFLTDPTHWTKYAYAKYDEDGNLQAACLKGVCLINEPDNDSFASALAHIRAAIKQSDIESWNDHHSRTHSDILSALDTAISLARAEGAPQL